VLLSDGDPELVDVMRQNIALNHQSNAFGEVQEGQLCGKVQATCIDFLEMKSVADADSKFDVIMCADCVYDTRLHIPLLHKIRQFLRPEGKVILMASVRGGSLEVFLHTARAYFGSVYRSVDYSDEVRNRLRGHKCFPHLVLLDIIAAGKDEDWSIMEDKVSKRYIKRAHKVRLKLEEEQSKIQRYNKKFEPVTTLKNNQLNSMIERLQTCKKRETSEDSSRTVLQKRPATCPSRPRTSEVYKLYPELDEELIKQLRDCVKEALGCDSANSGCASPCPSNSELAVDSPSQSCSGEGRSAKEQVGAEWFGNGLGWLNSNASQRSTKTGLREEGNWTAPLF
jgi:SAM-dependent methyltransferase